MCPDDGGALTVPQLPDPAVAAALASDYRILDWLGSGGMGTVFLAEQIRVGNRKVALKVLHRRFSEDDEFITRFQNEAASTGRINQPNVITIYESKQAADGTLYIAMELVEGESLTDHLRKRGPLPLGEVVEIVTQVCKALQAAHRLGIIHRDIKPDNIMLARDLDGGPLVKILDFGIAKLKDSSGHTVTGSVLGTPAYMSYEQASGLSSEKLDGRSDIYSLGLVTYAMLAGHPPFQAETPVGYITKHLSEAPPPIGARRPDMPAAVEACVLKAIEKDRDRRYQTAAEFATALRSAAPTPAAAAAAPRPLEPVATPPPPWRTRPLSAQTTKVAAPTPQAPTPQVVAPTPRVTAPTPQVTDPTAPVVEAKPGYWPLGMPAPSPSGTAPPTRPPTSPTPAAKAPTVPRPVKSPAASPPAAKPPVAPPPVRPAAPATPVSRPPEPPRAAPERLTPPPRAQDPAAPRPLGSEAGAPARPPAARPLRDEEPTVSEERGVRHEPGPWEGLAVAMWGLRTLVSWGLTVYGVALLVLFASPMLAPFVAEDVLLPILLLGQPIVQAFGWLPALTVKGVDLLPLILGVILLLVRPRVTTALGRLEERWRARAGVGEVPG